MNSKNYKEIQARKLSNLYQAILDIQSEYQSTDVQYYYESSGLLPLHADEWNKVTEKAIVFGVQQMFHDFIPAQAEEYLAEILKAAQIVPDIEPLRQRCPAVISKEDAKGFKELKRIGNVLDTKAPLGEFWQRNELVKIQFGYEQYENVIMQYTEFLRACWYYTKAVCGNTSRKNVEPYLKKISDSLLHDSEPEQQNLDEATYEDLCSYARESYPSDCEHTGAELVWSQVCKNEINLWTYWQGKNVRHPKILLVGQDWGCPADFPEIIENIEAMNNGKDRKYCENAKLFPTDVNLAKLFQVLHYDDIMKTEYDDLFFTNLVLGYRVKGSSGGDMSRWVRKDLKIFNRLVHILKPKVILCLGRNTFEGVLHAFGQGSPIKNESYNSYIEKRDVPKITLPDGQTAGVFPLAHCGSYGTMNRNASCGKSSTDLEKQKEDWQYINEYLNTNESANL